jgi:hypothetical protein
MSTKQLNHEVFSRYTPDSCYWAGFLAADGCLDINNTVRIELGGKDKDHVTKFKEFCNAEHLISHNQAKDSYKVGFLSKQVASDLAYNFNVTVDKTHSLKLPYFSNFEYYKHFIRGFFDGDGCLTEFFNNRPTASFRVYLTSGSLEFLEELLAWLQDNHVIVGGSIQKKAKNCWHIQLAVKDSCSFLDWIYLDASTYLDRKHDKYIDLIVNNNRAKKCN